jgi:hypothetical protein
VIEALEAKLAALERAVHDLWFATGMAAGPRHSSRKDDEQKDAPNVPYERICGCGEARPFS